MEITNKQIEKSMAIYYLVTDGLSKERETRLIAFAERYMPYFEPKRIERIEKCKNPEKRKELLVSGLLLLYAFAKWDIADELARVSYARNGKPESDSCYFNLSHTKGVIAVAMAKQPIGIDVEHKKEVKDTFVQRFFTKEEQEALFEKQESDRDVSFASIWTKKESMAKCFGTGLTVELHTIDTMHPSEDIRFYEQWLQNGAVCMQVCIQNL